MKKARGVLVITALLAVGTGCTSSKLIQTNGSPAPYAAVNASLASRDAEVRLTDGRIYGLYHVQLAADSLHGLNPFGGEPAQFAIDDIFEIRTSKDRSEGSATGALIGAGIGVAIE